ncbi:MAG: hypothetical protein WC384_00670 [Prolixibacteraceae bacterium]|jgi:hypothetical protein
MKKLHFLAVSLATVALSLAAISAKAQRDTTKLKQEVEVTKAYQPTIDEAAKINDIPQIKPEQTEAPTFDYSIYSKPVFATFDVTPITAAKMVGEPKPEMEMGLLKLGFGNYLTPYGELFFNARPDKKSNFGIHLRHLSSYGKIKLLNTDLVKAPEAYNTAEVFGKKFFRGATLSGSLGFDRKSFNYYGYAGNWMPDELKEEMIPYYQDKQYFSVGTANVRLKSETRSVYDMDYDFGINYHYFITKTGQSEHQTIISGDLKKKFDQTIGILHASIHHFKSDSIWNTITTAYGKKSQVMIQINPSAKWTADNASFEAGLNTTMLFDDDTDAVMFVWPKIRADWSPVPQILTLFVGADGYLTQNSYSAIAYENPYADPYHDVVNSNTKFVVSGGFKGKFSARTNYVAEVSYSKVTDQHFYITESQNLNNLLAENRWLKNTFSVVYDDYKLLKISAEVLHSVSDNFSLHLKGNYYSYNMNLLQEPWQMPNFDLTFSGIYQPGEKLKFNADIYVIGKRTALIRDFELPLPTIPDPNPVHLVNSEMQISMDPVFDLNAGADYQFSKKLGFFVRMHNFGFQKYEQWLGYTTKSFNWMAGISYTF